MLNIEMKRRGLLLSKLNRSELTQLGLQALARSKGRAAAREKVDDQNKSIFDPEDEAFSILTDCTTIYVLRHDVKNGKYWMSRGITDPSEQAVALCWLALSTHGRRGMTVSFDTAWKCPEVEEHEDTKHDPRDFLSVTDDEIHHHERGVRLPNGRSREAQAIFDKLAHRLCSYMGHYDLGDVSSSISVHHSQQMLPEEDEDEDITEAQAISDKLAHRLCSYMGHYDLGVVSSSNSVHHSQQMLPEEDEDEDTTPVGHFIPTRHY